MPERLLYFGACASIDRRNRSASPAENPAATMASLTCSWKSGTPRELNPRLDANCEVARRCGQDLPLLALEVQRHRAGEVPALPAAPAAYLHGRRCHWLMGDVLG